MTDLARRLTTTSRTSVVRAVADEYAPEHRAEINALLERYRTAETSWRRDVTWQRAAALATRPFRRRRPK